MNQFALIMKIIKASYELPSAETCSQTLRALIKWLLEKDADLRPSIRDLLNERGIRHKLDYFDLPVPDDLLDCALTNNLEIEEDPLDNHIPSEDKTVDSYLSSGLKASLPTDGVTYGPTTTAAVMSAASTRLDEKPRKLGTSSVHATTQMQAAPLQEHPFPSRGGNRGNRVRDRSHQQLSVKARTQHQRPKPKSNTAVIVSSSADLSIIGKTHQQQPQRRTSGPSDYKASDNDATVVMGRADAKQSSILSKSKTKSFKYDDNNSGSGDDQDIPLPAKPSVGDGFDTLRRDFMATLANDRQQHQRSFKEDPNDDEVRQVFDGTSSVTINRNRDRAAADGVDHYISNTRNLGEDKGADVDSQQGYCTGDEEHHYEDDFEDDQEGT